eukprot:3478625-Rhodomonas_salina.1
MAERTRYKSQQIFLRLETLRRALLTLGERGLVLDAVLTSVLAQVADGARPVVHEHGEVARKSLTVVELEVLQGL